MFERVKKAASTVSKNITKARAASRRMSVPEYTTEQTEIREKRRKSESEFRLWKVEEDYRQKKKRYSESKKGGGGLFGGGALNAIANIGENVNKNVSSSNFGSLNTFNRVVSGKGAVRKKRKKRKGKVIQIRVV